MSGAEVQQMLLTPVIGPLGRRIRGEP
jgi:hypothetical protein